MDIFIEEMIERKRKWYDVLFVLALAGFSTLVTVVMFSVSVSMPAISSLSFFIIVGVYYVSYRVAVSRNVEYEYAMVGNEIDIDAIINRKKRKRLTTVNARKLEEFGRRSKDASTFEKYASDITVKKVYACRDKSDADVCFAVYVEDGIKKILVFDPCDEIIETVVKFNPRKTFAV